MTFPQAEDIPHSAGHSGLMILAVRKDTIGSLADADGEYGPLLLDANGLLHVAAGATKCIDVTPVLTVHATYASGDYVGTSGTPITFADAARALGGTGWVVAAELLDYVVASVAAELWLFDAPVTPPADSAAWSISDADLAHCIGVFEFKTYHASALNSQSNAEQKAFPFKCAADSTNLYGCIVTRGAPAYVGDNVAIRLSIMQD